MVKSSGLQLQAVQLFRAFIKITAQSIISVSIHDTAIILCYLLASPLSSNPAHETIKWHAQFHSGERVESILTMKLIF